jgi:hypothetical protein
VADVLVGLIDADATSFRRSNQDWRPKKHLASYWPPSGDIPAILVKNGSYH